MLFLLIASCLMFFWPAQADISLNIVDASVGDVDERYFDPEKVSLIVNEGGDDVNTLSTNFTIIDRLPEDTSIHFYMLGYSMGEYKISIGIDVTEYLCDIFDDPMVLGPFLKVIGISKDECPPPPGKYGVDGYFPSLEMLPDTFPEGEYRIGVELVDAEQDTKFLELIFYVDIE